MDFLSKLFLNLLSAALGSIVTQLWQRMKSRSPFTKAVAISPRENILIVVPHRPEKAYVDTERRHVSPEHEHVTFADMLAVSYTERTLSLTGFLDEKIEVKSVRKFILQKQENYNNNLVLICSPKANGITKNFFAEIIAALPAFKIEFQEQKNSSEKNGLNEWRICFNGVYLESRSYQQEKELINRNMRPEEGELNDFALLARVVNPWYPQKKILIIAGIRGIGTWGAARFLREETRQLAKQSKGKDFACIIDVKYSNYKIIDWKIKDNLFLSF